MHAFLAEPPLDPSTEEARDLARRELARPEYNEPGSVIERVLEWLHLRQPKTPEISTGHSSELGPLADITMLLVLAAIVTLIVMALLRVRRDPRGSSGGVFDDEEELLAPEQYLTRAREALARGDWDAAYLDAFRVMTSRAAERTLLDDAPSRTAREVGSTLRGIFPEHDPDILHFAEGFDGVRYGGQHVGEAEARGALELEATVHRARPRLDRMPVAELSPLVAPGSQDPHEELPTGRSPRSREQRQDPR